MNNTPKHVVTIKTYKYPVTRDKKGKLKTDETYDFTEDMVLSKEDHEFDESISIQLGAFAKEVANYNYRQIKMANLDKKQTHYKVRIICKPD